MELILWAGAAGSGFVIGSFLYPRIGLLGIVGAAMVFYGMSN